MTRSGSIEHLFFWHFMWLCGIFICAVDHLVMTAQTFLAIAQSCQPLWTKCIMRGSIWASSLDLANKLDVSTKDFTTQISRCARCHQWHVALSLFATLPSRRLRSNVVTSTAAMAGGQGWRRAMELLQKILVDEIRVNSIAFNAVPGRLRIVCLLGLQKIGR